MMRTRYSRPVILALPLLILAATACGGDESSEGPDVGTQSQAGPDEAESAESDLETPSDDVATPEVDGVIGTGEITALSCEELGGAVAADLGGLHSLGADEGWDNGQGSEGMTCAWFTDPALDMVAGDIPSPEELAQYGAVVLNVNRPAMVLTEEDARLANFVFDDARAAAAGGYVMARPDLDPSASLSLIPPIVVVGDLEVSWAVGTPLLNDVDDLGQFTNDWAIGAALAVHEKISG